jgi:periplasmic divalent cation tolerance protein
MVRSLGTDNAPFWEARIMQDCKDLDILAVTTTVASRAEAQQLGRVILQRRLAACVQIEEGLSSLYRWQGKDCEDPEVRLTIKTLPECEQALRALFEQQHPYYLPQFLAVAMRASEAYHAWARGEVSVPAPSGEPDPV